MYVWRIPLQFFGPFVASTSLALVWIGVASLRRRVKSIVARGILLGVNVVATITSPFVVHVITRDELERMVKLGVYVHYSPYVYLAPAILVVVLFGLSELAFPRRQANTTQWRLKFWLTAFIFTGLNVANWCSPGWCERFGFPFPYSWWSDAIVVMNGETLTAGHSLIAFLVNISVFLVVVAVLAAFYRRSLGHTRSGK